ncbi:HlyD family type I secretion periplasmic adaptor subunit [Noviherbaspirillum pedocola]|uniref:Membrane fusion protein (MFP) family protein n=1 Tax=Noviherbaspirillum pedocola TaxID=2801341 RepID=A0A934SYM3_9BURK|nr:HlyD family type I secretion periplasmic adaptor subunit [Noviherbaspirillum pedocola]MBK4738003.1 HlyD family type I secretion periplasmic adaptor subunit [Noviherbaspirillum pedocola]
MRAPLSLHLAALADLLRRYCIVFAHAWRHRAELDTPPRRAHEAQFLPAALALQETPVSPAPRVTMWLLIAFAVIALLWSVFGRIDVVASADGRIVPDDRTKTIQPIETASVAAIHVTDGQEVRAGDVLIELDATMARADHERLRGELAAARLVVARGEALLGAIDAPAIDASLRRPPDVDDARYQDARQHAIGQVREYRAKAARIDAEAARHEAELRSVREMVRKLEQTLPIASRRAEDYRTLVEQSYVSQHGYLEREQARIELQADLATQRSRESEIAAALNESRRQREALAAETRRGALDVVNDASEKVAALEQEVRKADNRSRLMRLTAPVDGAVQQLAVHTVGGVVTPAQALMMIVPRDHPLEVQAYVENKDIGFVRAGQEAEIKVQTFQYSRYGTLPGRVMSVSHDAINDDKRGLVYLARIRMDRATMMVDGAEVSLTPGMAVAAEIKTGRRRVIEYFLSPLIEHASESLHER